MKTLDIKEVAALLKMNPEALRRIAKRGDIPARKVGKKWIFLESALEEWIKGAYTVNSQKLKNQPMNLDHAEVNSSWQPTSSKTGMGSGKSLSDMTDEQFREHLMSL